MPQGSFAMLKVWIDTSKAERTPPRPFGRWDVVALVNICGGCEKCGGVCVGCQEDPEPVQPFVEISEHSMTVEAHESTANRCHQRLHPHLGS